MSDTPNNYGVRVIEDDGNTVRVQAGYSAGSIYESSHAPQDGGPVIGGLHSGGLPLSERGGDSSVRATSGPTDLGGGLTARTSDGFPITNVADLQPDSIITLPNGMPVAWEVAKMLNLVNLGDSQPNQQEEQADNERSQQDVQKPKETEPMAPEAEAIMREVIDKAEGAAIGAMVDVIENDGTMSNASVEELASALQVEPAVIQQRTQVALQGYRDDAYRGAARAARTDVALAAEALQDARENRRSELNEKMQHHFIHGTTGQYGGMVADYIAALGATDPARVLSAKTKEGITVSQDGKGQVIVTIDGKAYPYESAVRNGLITVTS